MKRRDFIKSLHFVVLFLAPLYILKVSLFTIPSNIFEILAFLLAIFTLFEKRQTLSTALLSIPKIVFISCALILIGLLLSIIVNGNYRAGFGIFKGWFLIPLLFSTTFYLLLDSTQDIEKIYKTILFSNALVGAISLIYKIFDVTTYDNRLSGFYLSPNYLAMYLSPGVFFGIYFLLKHFSQKMYWKTILNSILLIIILIPLYFTYSYGSWVAVIVAVYFSIIAKNFKKRLAISAIFLVISFALLFFTQLDSKKLTNLINNPYQRSSFTSRVTIWQVSVLLLKEHPFLGVGPGNFQSKYLSYQKYFPPYLEWAVPHPHNIFLAFWLQAGLFGLIGFIGILLYIFPCIIKTLQNNNGAALAAPLFSFFVYSILHGLIDTTYWKNDLALLFWINFFTVVFLYKTIKDCKI